MARTAKTQKQSPAGRSKETEEQLDMIKKDRTKQFQKYMQDDREKVLTLMKNTQERSRVVNELLSLFPGSKKDLVKEQPTLCRQLDALCELMSLLEFDYMDKIIAALKAANNPELAFWFSCRKQQVLKKTPRAKNESETSDDVETDGIVVSRHQNLLPLYLPRTPSSSSNAAKRLIENVSQTGPSESTLEQTGTNEGSEDRDCNFSNIALAIAVGNHEEFMELLNKTNTIDDLKPCPGEHCQKWKGQTLLHVAALHGDSDPAKVFEPILTTMCDLSTKDVQMENGKKEIEKLKMRDRFLHEQDDAGQTVLHLAARNRRRNLVNKLYEKYTLDLLIKNNSGQTVLDLIYTYLPKVAWNILNSEPMVSFKNKDFEEAQFLEIDFGRIVGYPTVVKQVQKFEETKQKNLKLEQRQRSNSKKSGGQEEVKGQKTENKFYRRIFSSLFLLLLQCFELIREKLTSIQSKEDAVPDPQDFTEDAKNKLIRNYIEMAHLKRYIESDTTQRYELLSHVMVKLFVDLKWKKMFWFFAKYVVCKIVVYIFHVVFIMRVFVHLRPISMYSNTCTGNSSIPYSDSTDDEKCKVPPLCRVLFALIAVFGLVFFYIEILEIRILKTVQPKEKKRKWYYCCGYLQSWENRLQVLLYLTMVLLGLMAILPTIPQLFYSLAAVSVVLALILIYVEGGYALGQGMYVLVFGKIAERILKLVISYSVIIFAFSSGHSILLQNSLLFSNPWTSFGKVLTMLTGELEYKSILYGDESDAGRPSSFVEFPAHLLFLLTVITVSLALANTLIGLAVDDVRKQWERSEVLLLATKIDKLFTLEKMFGRRGRKENEDPPESKNWVSEIFLIATRNTWLVDGTRTPENAMKLRLEKKEIDSKILLEIEDLATEGEDYQYKDPRKFSCF